MKDILSEIIAHKRIEIEQQKQAVSLSQLQEQAAAMIQEAVGSGTSGTNARPQHEACTRKLFIRHHCRVQTPFPFQRLDQGKRTGRSHSPCL